MAPHAGLDPKSHLLKLRPDIETGVAVVGIDQNGNRRVRAEKRRYLVQSPFDGCRVAIREQADGVLSPRKPVRRNGSHAHEAAASKPEIELHYATAGDDRALQACQTREPDHCVEDL